MELKKATERFHAQKGKIMTTKTKWILQRFADESVSTQAASSVQTESQPGSPQEGDQEKQGGKKYSDEDLDRIIGKKFAEWSKKRDREVDEAARLANMNAQERAEHERDELQRQLDELRSRETLSQMTSTARTMLQEEGVNVPESVLTMLVNTDADKTKKAVSDFAAAFKSAVQAAVVEQLKGKPPKTGGSKSVTKADIMAIKNRAERQNLIREHQELFK